MSSDVARRKQSAQRGNGVAQFWLGVAYEQGRGVDRDFPSALRWFSESAKQDNVDAQNMLGVMYEAGEGTAQDYRAAAHWYRLACGHWPNCGGAGRGCNNLGLLYLDGHGVEQSRIEAYKYLTLGNNEGDAARVRAKTSAREVTDAESRLKQWFKQHPAK